MLAALAGCAGPSGPAADAPRIAQCIAGTASQEQLRAWGQGWARSGHVSIGVGAFHRCSALWAGLSSSALRRQVRQAMPAALMAHAAYRQGVYEVALPANLPPAARTAFADLARWLDNFAVQKRSTQACSMLPPETWAAIADVQTAFAVATLGHRGGVSDPRQAQELALLLLEQVADFSARDEGPACDDTSGLRRSAADLETFVSGQHPWAPGCRVREEGAYLQLVCEGAVATGASAGPR
jgi:hypothetical protein